MRFSVSHLLAAVIAVVGLSSAHAQGYPNKPIRVIVPSAAGGSPDILVRTVATEAGRRLGQTFVIENKPGGAGFIGMIAIEQAAPDGYTIGYGNNATLATNKSLFNKLPYKPENLIPIVLLAKVPSIIAVNRSVPENSLAELLAEAKKKPGKFTFGSSGLGTSPHLTGELISQYAKSPITHVPYKGSPAAIADVVGGQVDIMIDNMSSIAPFVKDGRLKPLAITSTTRSQLFPDVPTVAETVLPGFESVGWGGLVAPAGTPKAAITKMNAIFNEVLRDPQMKEKLLSMGMETAGGSEEEFRTYAESEAKKWRPIIEKANIQVN